MTIPAPNQTVHLMNWFDVLRVYWSMCRKEGRNARELDLYTTEYGDRSNDPQDINGRGTLLLSPNFLLLIFRRGAGVYLLAAAFLVGLSVTLWDFRVDDSWPALPLLNKIGRIDGFVISLAIVIYMIVLMQKRFFRGWRNAARP